MSFCSLQTRRWGISPCESSSCPIILQDIVIAAFVDLSGVEVPALCVFTHGICETVYFNPRIQLRHVSATAWSIPHFPELHSGPVLETRVFSMFLPTTLFCTPNHQIWAFTFIIRSLGELFSFLWNIFKHFSFLLPLQGILCSPFNT